MEAVQRKKINFRRQWSSDIRAILVSNVIKHFVLFFFAIVDPGKEAKVFVQFKVFTAKANSPP